MAIPDSTLPGHAQLHDRVRSALERCQESPAIDFKESSFWEQLRHTIVKNVLAMGNLRDGGIVVIGASERNGTWELNGITDEHFASYDADTMLGCIGSFVSPHAKVDIVRVIHTNGHPFLCVQTYEFDEIPLICKKNGPDGEGLLEGAVYVRPPGVPRATRMMNAEQMRDLLRLAAEKQARRILEDARRIGVLPDVEVQPRQELPIEFERELEGL